MTYSLDTDSYNNDFLEPILDTGFRCNIPYKIDRKKYAETIEKYGQYKSSFDSDVVSFSFDFDKNENGKKTLLTFYAYQENCTEENDEDDYDCFVFNDDRNAEEEYQNFVHELMECIIEVNVPATLKLRNDKFTEIKRCLNELDIIDYHLFH